MLASITLFLSAAVAADPPATPLDADADALAVHNVAMAHAIQAKIEALAAAEGVLVVPPEVPAPDDGVEAVKVALDACSGDDCADADSGR